MMRFHMKIYEFNSNEKNLFIKTTDTLFPQLPKENIIVFDIDTTSFEAANGCVFLIGTLTYEDNTLISRHYFSESISEETEIISKFLDIAGNYNVLPLRSCLCDDLLYLAYKRTSAVDYLAALGLKDLFLRRRHTMCPDKHCASIRN